MSEWLQCIGCERRFDASEIRYTCECGELLSVERDAMPDRDLFDARLASRKTIDRSGVWRFREAVLNVAEEDIVTHPEGSTRLYEREWEWGVGSGRKIAKRAPTPHSQPPTPHSASFSNTKARIRPDRSKTAA
jgi:threonine synthase